MQTRRIAVVCLAVVVFLSWAHVVCAMMFIQNEGTWPDSWPKELDAYRKQAKSIGVGHGTQETVYEIPFDSREEFEKAWPHILTLKSTGAPLILEKSLSTYGTIGSKMTAGVRVLWPSDGAVENADGTLLHSGAPWPDYIKSASGELPEYVMPEDGRWLPFTAATKPTILYRARVDIVLITDGQVVDLNRIALPANTPIVDRRFGK